MTVTQIWPPERSKRRSRATFPFRMATVTKIRHVACSKHRSCATFAFRRDNSHAHLTTRTLKTPVSCNFSFPWCRQLRGFVTSTAQNIALVLFCAIACARAHTICNTSMHKRAKTHTRKPCTRTCVHTHMLTCTNARMHTHAHARACTHTHTNTRTHACTHAHTHTHTRICT